MAALSQEIALQWELSGKVYLFAVPESNTRLKHSVSSNHVARSTRFLVSIFTCEVSASSELIVSAFIVGPIERIRDVNVGNISWMRTCSNVLLGILKDFVEISLCSECSCSNLGELECTGVLKLLHFDLSVGLGFPGEVLFIDFLCKLDSQFFGCVIKCSQFGGATGLRELLSSDSSGLCKHHAARVVVAGLGHDDRRSLVSLIVDSIAGGYMIGLLSDHTRELLRITISADSYHCFTAAPVKVVVIACLKRVPA